MLCLRRCCIARSTRVAKRQITQRAASRSCPGSFQECHWSGFVPLINRTTAIRRQTHVNQPSKSASRETSRQTHAQPLFQHITEATEAPILESGKALGHTQPHCADAFHLTLRVEGLDAVKHHARSTFHGQVVRTRHDEHQVDASACCMHEEPSIPSLASARPSVRPSHTLTRPRL